jgi:hypothetical protein
MFTNSKYILDLNIIPDQGQRGHLKPHLRLLQNFLALPAAAGSKYVIEIIKANMTKRLPFGDDKKSPLIVSNKLMKTIIRAVY